MYAGFKDFHFFKVTPERAHLVAGFGKIRWLSRTELMLGVKAEGKSLEDVAPPLSSLQR